MAYGTMYYNVPKRKPTHDIAVQLYDRATKSSNTKFLKYVVVLKSYNTINSSTYSCTY